MPPLPVALRHAAFILLASLALCSSSEGAAQSTQNPSPADLRSSLQRLARHPTRLAPASVPNGVFPPLSAGAHHIQSVVRYGSKYILSHSTPEALSLSALLEPGGVVREMKLTPRDPHLGGLQVLGNHLVGALDSGSHFWDLTGITASSTAVPVVNALYDQPGAGSAVAAVRVGARLFQVVMETRNKLRFYRRDDGQTEWTLVDVWAPGDQTQQLITSTVCNDGNFDCCEEATWCRSQNFNLYFDPDQPTRLQLLTFAPVVDQAQKDRVDLFEVTFSCAGANPMTTTTACTVALVPREHVYVNRQADETMRAGAGSQVKSSGALEVFSCGQHLCSTRDPKTCSNQISTYAELPSSSAPWTVGRPYDWGDFSDIGADLAWNVVQAHQPSSDEHENQLYYAVGRADPISRTISWSPSTSSGTGRAPSIAVNTRGFVLEAHEASSTQPPIALWYRVGILNYADRKIDWKTSDPLADSTGKNIDVAINELGTVVEIHNGSTSDRENNLYVRAGKLEGTTVAWGPVVRLSGTGTGPSISIDSLGRWVAVYRGAFNNDLFTVVGTVRSDVPRTVTVERAVFLDTGDNPAIAMAPNGRLIEMHNGSAGVYARTLYYRSGRLNELGVIDWTHSSGRPLDTGRLPSVAIDPYGNTFESHNGNETANRIYYGMGQFGP